MQVKTNRVEKITTLHSLAEIARSLKSKGKTVVHCHGVFDLIHPGHIRHFEAAKKRGDVLLVTVTSDRYVNKGPGRPVFKESLRAESVAALACTDYIAISDSPTAVKAITVLQPHFYAKGNDYTQTQNDVTGGITLEENAVRSIGGKLIFTDEITFSSTSILNHYFNVYPEEAQSYLKIFSKKYGAEDIIQRMHELKHLKVLVLGETIMDQYIYCQTMGKSPKENIVSTRYISEETFTGGSLAAANHIAGFVDQVHLVTCLGKNDNYEKFIRARLKPNIKLQFFYHNAPTILKRRFVDAAFLTKMFEISYLDDHPLDKDVEENFLDYLHQEIPKHDLVFVTDYGHGLIGPSGVKLLHSKSSFLAVNTQTNSANYGFNPITKYPQSNYVCIDEPELRIAERNKFAPLENLMKDLTKKLKVEHLVVTRGHLGSIAYSHKNKNAFYKTPVFSEKIVDRTGAGDAFFSVTAPCVAAGFPIDLVSFIGNAAGALAVTIVCNREPVQPVALYKFITALLK